MHKVFLGVLWLILGCIIGYQYFLAFSVIDLVRFSVRAAAQFSQTNISIKSLFWLLYAIIVARQIVVYVLFFGIIKLRHSTLRALLRITPILNLGNKLWSSCQISLLQLLSSSTSDWDVIWLEQIVSAFELLHHRFFLNDILLILNFRIRFFLGQHLLVITHHKQLVSHGQLLLTLGLLKLHAKKNIWTLILLLLKHLLFLGRLWKISLSLILTIISLVHYILVNADNIFGLYKTTRISCGNF